MNLLDEITANFKEWHCQIFDDGLRMHSRKFSGDIHHQLKSRFKSTFNSLSDGGNQTIVISCFMTYTNVAVFIDK